MNISRRFFLGGALAVAGASIIPAPLKALSIPSIWGDGIHDDAPGLNALLSGSPVNIVADAVGIRDAQHVWINGRFLLNAPMVIQIERVDIPRIHIITGTAYPHPEPMIRVGRESRISIDSILTDAPLSTARVDLGGWKLAASQSSLSAAGS